MGVDREQVQSVMGSLLLTVGLNVSLIGWGDLVDIHINSLSDQDLEVWVIGIVHVAIGSSLVSLYILLDFCLQPFDFVFVPNHCKVVDFFLVLDGLHQTGGYAAEGVSIDVSIGGEYILHSMG